MDESFKVARRREVKPGNSGLPHEAWKCADEEINKLLQSAWVEEIRLYVEMGGLTGCGAARMCGLRDHELEEVVTPEVEGHTWYRGYVVGVEGGRVFLFNAWMQPWCEGGAPDPIVYVVGDVARNDILRLVQSYCNGILSYIEKRRRLNELTKTITAEIITIQAELAALEEVSQTVLQKSLLLKR